MGNRQRLGGPRELRRLPGAAESMAAAYLTAASGSFPFQCVLCRQWIVSRCWCRAAAVEPSPEGEAERRARGAPLGRGAVGGGGGERRPRGALVGRGSVARGWSGGCW